MTRKERAVSAAIRGYFELSYRLLLGSPEGRRFLDASSPVAPLPVHGYATHDDLDAVTTHLALADGVHVLDLGSGLGGPAMALGLRTGATITGLEYAPRAVRSASSRSIAAGLQPRVSFLEGPWQRPPRLGACGAYALDALMFARIDGPLLIAIRDSLEGGGRLVTTLLTVGTGAHDPLARAAERIGMYVVESSDVTVALIRESARRRGVARRLLLGRPHTVRGRLAMVLVVIEETGVLYQARRGRLRRWRTVVDLAGPG